MHKRTEVKFATLILRNIVFFFERKCTKKKRKKATLPHLSIENTHGLGKVMSLHNTSLAAVQSRQHRVGRDLQRRKSNQLGVLVIILLLTQFHVWCYHQSIILGVWILWLVDYLKGVVCSPVVKVMAQTGDYLEKKEIVSKKNWRYFPSSVFMFIMIGIFMLGIWWILQKSYKSKGFNFRNNPRLDKVHIGEQKKGKVGHLDTRTIIGGPLLFGLDMFTTSFQLVLPVPNQKPPNFKVVLEL